jgi:hypothetical protein
MESRVVDPGPKTKILRRDGLLIRCEMLDKLS